MQKFLMWIATSSLSERDKSGGEHGLTTLGQANEALKVVLCGHLVVHVIVVVAILHLQEVRHMQAKVDAFMACSTAKSCIMCLVVS